MLRALGRVGVHLPVDGRHLLLLSVRCLLLKMLGVLRKVGTLVLQLPGGWHTNEVLPGLRHDPAPAVLRPRDHARAIRGIKGRSVHIRRQGLLLVIP